MGRNKRKIAFIICVNDEEYYKECLLYLQQLKTPDGFTVEYVPVTGIKSMAQGYNIGISRTDAKYKVYMHQDVFIINPNFLNDVLTVFKQNWRIGMIGVLGSPILPVTGVPWHGNRVGNLYQFDKDNVDFNGYEYSSKDGMTDVQSIDGLLMVTKEDVPWREDLFDGWDFYDASQCFEFIRRGYHVVVPNQKKPWVAHDETSGLNQWSYDKYRHIFLDEYADMIK